MPPALPTWPRSAAKAVDLDPGFGMVDATAGVEHTPRPDAAEASGGAA